MDGGQTAAGRRGFESTLSSGVGSHHQRQEKRRTETWHVSRCVNCSITRRNTITACRPSTSTIWSRRWPSWTPPPHSDVMLRHMMDALTEIHPLIAVCVHLDHGNEPATCMTAIQAGFTSVMMDGSLK